MKRIVLSLTALSLALLAPAGSAAEPVYRADADTIPAGAFPTSGVEVLAPLIPIYDNLAASPVYFYRGQGGAEAIDDLHAVRAGVLTKVQFQYYEPGGAPFSATIKVYGNPGGTDEATPLVGGPYVVEGLMPGVHLAEFTLPGGPVVGPDLWVGVRFSSPTAGLALNDVPAIGMSHDYFLEDGTLYFFGGRPKANFCIRVSVRMPVTPTGDVYHVDEDDVLQVAAPGVLANDGEDSGVGLSAEPGSDVAHGALSFAADGSFTYTPTPDYHGEDGFTYTAVRDEDLSGPATVTIVVDPVNDVPVAVGESFVVAEDGTLLGSVLGNDEDIDGDELQAVLAAPPDHGSVALALDGSFSYLPSPDYFGEDSFRYTATDGEAVSNEAVVSITVEPVNDPPVAVADTASARAGTPVTIAALENDTDVDDTELAVAQVWDGAHGTAALGPPGTVVYTAELGYVGQDTLRYSVADPSGAADTTLVAVQVVFGGPAPTVLAGPLEYAGHAYYLLSFSPWEDAEAAAVALGGHLATIDDRAEQDWVFDMFTESGAADRSLWVGLTDRETEGAFVWASGDPISYTNWQPGQPDQCAGAPENYACLLPPSDADAGTWVDLMNEGGGGCGGQWYPHGVVEVPVVIDPTPIISVPADVLAEATGPSGAEVHFEVTAESPRCGPVPVTCTPPSGSVFPLGETTVVCEAECEGAVASASFVVRVVDTTPPELVCLASIIVECAAFGGTPVNDAQLAGFFAGATASDLVDPAPTVLHDAPSLLPVGATEVTFTATDFTGNASTCIATVEVVDTRPPAITVTLSRYVLWPANHRLADIHADVAVFDTCDANPTFVLESVVSSEPTNGTGDGDTAPDVLGADLGAPDVDFQLRSERAANGDGRVYTVTYAATDACGNTARASAVVRVPRNMGGGAAASLGFRPDGTSLDLRAPLFALVVYSTAEAVEEWVVEAGDMTAITTENWDLTEEKKAPAVDAGRVVVSQAYVGNLQGVLAPESSFLQDLNGDGLDDLTLLYSTGRATRLIRDSSPEAGPLGMYYGTDDGASYVVADIFALGPPVAFGSAVDVPATGRGGGVGGVRPQGETPDAGRIGSAPLLTSVTAVHPNPFSGKVTMAFDLFSGRAVRLAVYDARGTLVRTLLSAERPAGRHEVYWDGRSQSGRRLPAGLYFLRLEAGEVRQTRKVVMMD